MSASMFYLLVNKCDLRINVCTLCGRLSPFLLSEERPGLWWEHSSLIKTGPSRALAVLSSISSAHLVLPSPGDGVCWVGAGTRRDCACCRQTSTTALTLVFKRQDGICWSCFTVCVAVFCFFITTQHFHMLPLAHGDDTAVLTSTCYLGFTHRITRCFPRSDCISISKPLRKHSCRQHLKNNAGRVTLSVDFCLLL